MCSPPLRNTIFWVRNLTYLLYFQVRLDYRHRHLHRPDQGRGVHQNGGLLPHGQQCQVEVPKQGPGVERQRKHRLRMRVINSLNLTIIFKTITHSKHGGILTIGGWERKEFFSYSFTHPIIRSQRLTVIGNTSC